MRTIPSCLLVLALLAAPAAAQLDAAFSVDATTGTHPASFQFTDLTTGGTPLSWLWQFGDGATSSLPSPSHAYTAPGTYSVSLTVQAAGFQFDTETKVDLITFAPALLVPDFAVDVATGQQPLEVQFSDLSVGAVDAWLWDFGDGASSTLQHPAHTYTVTATTGFDVSLTVWLQGQSATLLVEDAVVVEPATLVAGFVVSDALVESGQPLQLVNTTVSSGPETFFDWEVTPTAHWFQVDSPVVTPYVQVPTRFTATLTASVVQQQDQFSLSPAFGAVPPPFVESQVPTPWSGSLQRLVTADLDLDGDADVLVVSVDQVAWLANDGQAQLGEPQVLVTGLPALAGVTVADLTGDGAPDVLTFDQFDTALLSVNDGLGSFVAPQTVAALVGRCRDVVALDADGDGDLDLAAAQWQFGGGFDHRVLVLANGAPTGSFTVAAQNTTIDTLTLRVFDGDADGDPDLLVDDGWVRNQHPTWIAHPAAWELIGGDVGDLDGDGDLDGLGSLGGPGVSSGAQWVENRGLTTLVAHPLVAAGGVPLLRASFARLGDLDQDGDLDAAGAESASSWGWLQHPGDPDTPWPLRLQAHDEAHRVALADLDGDGDLDLVHDEGITFADEDVHVALGRWVDTIWVQTSPALAGPSGRSGLVGHGALSSGAPFGLTIDQGRPGGAAYLIAGTAALDAPFKGGVLGPEPTLILPVGTVESDGLLPLLFDWPGGLPTGVDVWLQAWIQDPQLPAGYSATRTLRTTTL